MTVVSTSVRVWVILLAIAGTAGQVAYLDALWWHSLGLTTTVARDVGSSTIMLLAAHAVVSLVCSVLAIVLVLHERQRDAAGRALGLAFAAWSYLMAYSGVTLLYRPAVPGMARDIFEAHFLAIEVLGLVGLLSYTGTFPRRLADEELEPSPTLPPVLLPFHHVAVFLRRPGAPLQVGIIVLVLLWGSILARGGELSDAGLSRGMDAVRFLAAGVVVMHLRRSWGSATEGDRDGLMWLLAALAVLLGSLALLIGGNVLVAVTGFPDPRVAWRPILLDIGMIGFLMTLALSVLARAGSDPLKLTQRIASTSVVITAGLFLAAGLEALFTSGVLGAYTLRGGVGTAIALSVTLSMHRPLARVVARLVPT